MSKGRKTHPKKQYVIGRNDAGFCSLISQIEGETTDDQNLEMARRFDSLAQAIGIASDLGVSVFKILNEDWPASLRELKVDLGAIAQLPFEGSYRVAENFLAGPCFLTPTVTQSLERIAALHQCGVTCIVSLLRRQDLFRTRHLLENASDAAVWQQHFFPIPNGETPSVGQMRMILDAIDHALNQGLTVYASCIAGRGRTGTVVGCWLSRHGESENEEALDALAELRWSCGLFSASPETEVQQAFVRDWKKNQ